MASRSSGDNAELRSLRALAILETVSREDRVLSIGELEELCGLPRATLYRLTDKLVREDYLHRQIGGRGFTIGHRLLSLAHTVLGSDSVRVVRHEILTELVEQVGETCNLSVPDGSKMMYLDRVEAHWPLRLHMPAGTRVPMHCTANGKLYMAFLDEAERRRTVDSLSLDPSAKNTLVERDKLLAELECIKKQNYSTDNEEFISGMIAVSVPITNSKGRMIAGVAVTAPIARMSLDDAIAHLPALRSAADKMSNYLDRA